MTNLIVSIDFFFGLILNEDCKWILLDEADVLLVLVQYSRSLTKNATFSLNQSNPIFWLYLDFFCFLITIQ